MMMVMLMYDDAFLNIRPLIAVFSPLLRFACIAHSRLFRAARHDEPVRRARIAHESPAYPAMMPAARQRESDPTQLTPS
jgi:hypothetical protein